MTNSTKLTIIKSIHTAIWIFFNIVIFYILFAAISGRIDRWLWLGYALVAVEGLVLAIFRFICPLTIIARKYSDSPKDNFDIYLPNWLARNTKLIYTSIVVIAILITIYQVLR